LIHRFFEPIPKKRESSFGTSYYLSYSRKVGRSISAFSNIEIDNITCCEMNYHVTWYCERPATFQTCFNGKNYLIAPDLYVEYDNGESEFQWVHYKDKEIENKNEILFWGAQSGENVRFVNEDDLHSGPYYIRNLNYLCAKARRYEDDVDSVSDRMLIYNIIQEKMTIGKLISRGLIDKNKGISYLSDLYYRGIITFYDIENRTICFQTEVIANEIG